MIKSFLLLGQSNMAGRGFLHEVPPIYNERIQMLRNGRWQMMTEPINYDRPVAGIGPAASFADAWCRENDEDTIGLIPCAEGGSALDEWAVTDTLFTHAVSEAKFAMQTSRLAGILWHQGESDSHNGNYKTYYEKLAHIFTALRKELNAPHLPILIGGLGDYLGKTAFGQSCTEYNLINDELRRLTREQENCYFVTAAGLSANPDGIHIDARSQRIFGHRYFQAYLTKQHVANPLDNETDLLNHNQDREYTKSEQMYLCNLQFVQGQISFAEFQSMYMEICARDS